MIRKINITIPDFVKNYLPIHKRKNVRLNFLYSLTYVFDIIKSEYIIWRDEAVTRAYVTGETMSMEWYLNSVCGSGTGITIETAGASGVNAGLYATEPSTYISAGLYATESGSYGSVGLPGESTLYGTKTFIVKVPTAYSAWNDTIIAIVNTYRAAGKSFKIVLY